jgi:hypothetical protein
MKHSTLNVCFVLDCTASMGPWIDAAKHKILGLLDDLSQKYTNFKIYAAFIGYRDFGEEWFHVMFTDNHRHIYNHVMDISPLGGGDSAEDVAGAYHWVTNLNWDADVRAVFHITDAPAHGLMYHNDLVSDDYPNGNPTVDLDNEVKKLAKKQIDLSVFRLNSTTDIMYDHMRYVYTRTRLHGFRVIDFTKDTNQTPDDTFYTEISTQLQYSMNTFDPTNS